MTAPAISEREFQDQVLQLAALLGWEAVHFRPAETRHGWRTPVQGSLGKGWPDLTLVRGERLLFVELKRDLVEKGPGPRIRPDHPFGDDVTPEQERVLRLLGATGAGVFIWRPSQFDAIAALLGAS